jgi:hypothetical protein
METIRPPSIIKEFFAFVNKDTRKEVSKRCQFMDCGYCCHFHGPIECHGYEGCAWFKPKP